MRWCAGDRGRLLAVSYPLSAVCFTQAGGRRESRQRPATFSLKSCCALSEAMHKIVPHFPLGDTICLRSGRRLPAEPSKPYESLIFPATMPAPIRKMPAHWMGVMDSPSTRRAMTRATGSSDAASTEPRPGPTWGMPQARRKGGRATPKYQGGSHRGGEGARRKNQKERPAEGEGRSAGYHRWT